ncbi:MAG TPA: hypothetical protein VH540_20260 [Ktedonobacterales bacterium]
MDALPLALLRLRESDVVRLCGLARAARGQEMARQGKITQAERVTGTLRATILEGETSRVVAAHFPDAELDAWECSCPVGAARKTAVPGPEAAAGHPQEEYSQELVNLLACEHVAALLSAWLQNPRQFHTEGNAQLELPARMPVVQGREAAPVSPTTDRLPALAPLESLGPVARRFLGLLALAGGSVTDEAARRLFARMGLGPIEAAPQMLSNLREAGWLEPLQPSSRGHSRPLAAVEAQSWAIPPELRAQVPRKVTLEEAAVGAGRAGLRAQPAEGQRLPEQLVLALALAVAQPPAAQPTPADLLHQLQEQLALPGEQARFLLALLYQAGLISGEQAHLKTPAPGAASQEQPGLYSGAVAGETLLRGARFLLWREASEVARDLLSLWLHARPARELADLRDAGVRVATLHKRERQAGSDIAAENQAAKAFVLDLLGAVPAGRWWSFSSWVEFVWRFRPNFLRGQQPRLLRPEWWLERASDGETLSPEVRAEWREGEGRYLALLFRRALHWLGLLDLAFDAQGRLKAFQVTEHGARLLSKSAPVSHQHSAALADATPQKDTLPLSLQMQGDDCLVVGLAALREGGPSSLETLLDWCEPAGATADGLLLRPTARRVAAALDASRDLEAWLAALESNTPAQPAIKALVARVRGWAAAYGRVRLSPSVALLEVSDASLMRELERVANLAERRDYLLAPGMAVIRPAEVEPLIDDLRRRGYLPWMMRDEDAH